MATSTRTRSSTGADGDRLLVDEAETPALGDTHAVHVRVPGGDVDSADPYAGGSGGHLRGVRGRRSSRPSYATRAPIPAWSERLGTTRTGLGAARAACSAVSRTFGWFGRRTTSAAATDSIALSELGGGGVHRRPAVDDRRPEALE